jgi:hypothetical protein
VALAPQCSSAMTLPSFEVTMRSTFTLLASVGLLVLAGCGGSDVSNLFDSGGDDGGGADGQNPNGDGSALDTGLVDTGTPDTQPPCVGLECQQVKCGDGGTTTISGVVTTPNGKFPIYNATVWIPNAAVAPITDGVQCDSCQAPLSGAPLVVATTDEQGAFKLANAPVGMNIPVVVQLGKWRRETKINVTQCTDNAATKDAVRLPKTQQEGHMPLIALQAGCDRAECALLQAVGIDGAEFTGPGGTGRVHVYLGQNAVASTLPANPGSAPALWGDLTTLKKYDLVVNTCECQPTLKDTMGNGYDAMKKYLEAGGRLLANHYHYNLFANQMQCQGDQTCKGPMDFNGIATWTPNGQPPNGAVSVDTSHPRGKAFSTWLVNTGASMMAGSVTLGDLRGDVGAVNVPTTRWLYGGNATTYMSFNAPLGQNQQCGRAAFSDMHIRSTGGGGAWPASCGNAQFANNETATTFLFFDVFGCVQDDTKAPVVPPTK